MIELKNVNKIYQVAQNDFYALRDVSLAVEDGDFVAICGASGSGKSTLLNIIGCIDELSTGQYILNGTDIAGLKDKKKARIRNQHIGFVLQDFALINSQTVLYNVMLPLLFSKCPYAKIRELARKALQIVGVGDQADKRVNQLSGGQRQRVAIARAIVNEPKVILADEPTGQLDSKTSAEIIALLSQLNERGITVIVVTHDPVVAESARRIVTLSDGAIIDERIPERA